MPEPLFFGARMFTYTEHRHMTDKFVNAEHEQSPSIRSGFSEAHIHTRTYKYVYIYRERAGIAQSV